MKSARFWVKNPISLYVNITLVTRACIILTRYYMVLYFRMQSILCALYPISCANRRQHNIYGHCLFATLFASCPAAELYCPPKFRFADLFANESLFVCVFFVFCEVNTCTPTHPHTRTPTIYAPPTLGQYQTQL